MMSEFIEKNLDELKNQKEFDNDFIDILKEANKTDEDRATTTNKILTLIKQKYDKSKKNKT